MRVGVFVTHPVQYHVPIWRTLAATPGIDLVVHYFSDHSVAGRVDEDFGRPVAWDVPMLEGYGHRFVSRHADLAHPSRVALPAPRRTLEQGRFEAVLVHGYTHRFERQVVAHAHRMGLRVVMRGEFYDVPRGNPLRRAAREILLKWMYPKVTAFGTIGVNARRHLLARGVPESRMFFSPYAIDDRLFGPRPPEPECRALRARLGLPAEAFVFIASGKLIPRKEPLLLLEAMSRMKRRETCALVMLGDGPLRAPFEARGGEVLGSRLVFPGFVNQSGLAPYFHAADAFVFPTNFETWGLVVNEAMTCGLPAITSDRVGCVPDLVHPGWTGWVFRSGDADALAASMDEAASDPARARKMGNAARALVAGYSIPAAAEGLLRALRA